MTEMDYTVVIAVDRKTLECLRMVYPTWAANKPSLLDNPWCVIYDVGQVTQNEIISAAPGLSEKDFVGWPPRGVEYKRDGLTKWANPQRAKMLAGFVHVPPLVVSTPYWLKLDLDVAATGMDDWIDSEWFDGNPSIIAPSWSYTKPKDQMLKMDEWASRYAPHFLKGTSPLNLIPNPDSDKVCHPRICSWCAFFSTEFSRLCSMYANQTVGYGQIPIDSQDGYLFYCAKRGGFAIRVFKPKQRGWKLCHSPAAVRDFVNGVA